MENLATISVPIIVAQPPIIAACTFGSKFFNHSIIFFTSSEIFLH